MQSSQTVRYSGRFTAAFTTTLLGVFLLGFATANAQSVPQFPMPAPVATTTPSDPTPNYSVLTDENFEATYESINGRAVFFISNSKKKAVMALEPKIIEMAKILFEKTGKNNDQSRRVLLIRDDLAPTVYRVFTNPGSESEKQKNGFSPQLVIMSGEELAMTDFTLSEFESYSANLIADAVLQAYGIEPTTEASTTPSTDATGEKTTITSNGTVTELTDAEYDAKITNTTGIVVLDVYTTWCGPCKRMAPEMESAAKNNTTVRFYKMDAEKNRKTSSKLSVGSIPAIFIYRDGVLKKSLVGFHTKAQLESEIKNLK